MQSILRTWPAAALLLAAGCGLTSAGEAPRVMAHRAAAGYWPENSRTAVRGSIERGFRGIEIDLAITKDGVPVLSHDPWVHDTLCTRADGTPLAEGERLLIRDLTLDEYKSGFVCGGVRDEAMPKAEVVAEAPMTLDEVLAEVSGHPDVVVQLDVKYDPAHTQDAQTFAEAILGRWEAAALPNPVYVSATKAELLRAFKARAPAIETTLIWPEFSADRNDVVVAVENELSITLGLQDLAGRIEDADADGIAIAWQVIDRHAVEQLRDQGFKVRVWTANTPALMERLCSWPIDAIITDYPEDAPCR